MPDLDHVHERLREILASYRADLSVTRDGPGGMALEVPGLGHGSGGGDILAVEVSTKPLINLVWLGAILMLGSAFLSVARRAIDLRRARVASA